MKIYDKVFLITILVVFVTAVFIRKFSNKSENVLLDYVSLKSSVIISEIINKSISDVLYESNYDSIIKDTKDQNGNVVNIDFDNLIVNRLLYQITENILDSIKKQYNNKEIYYVPLGTIYDTPILNNLGPLIPFKIDYVGGINSESNIDVKEYGINSSIIILSINVVIQIKVILPFSSKTVTVSKNMILDSKIVQGRVPDYYGGLISNSLN